MAALKLSTKKYLPFVAALFVTALSLALFVFLGALEKERDFHRYRSYAFSSLNIISERLHNVLNSRLIPIEGLSAYISIHPEITKKEFNDFARQIMARQKGIHSIELVKGTVITDYIYPLEGNEKAIGLDLISMPAEQEAIRRAIDKRETVIAGPVDLVQGGVAFISRSPIFTAVSRSLQQKDQYWGLTQAIITTDSVFEEAGLYDKTSDFNFAIRGKDATGASGDVFFGNKDIFQLNPVKLEIMLLNGSWQLAAIPKTGWDSAARPSFKLNLIGKLISLLLGCLVFVYLRSQQRAMKTEDTLKTFEILFSEIMDLAFVCDTQGNIIFVNKSLERLTGRKPEEFTGKSLAPLFDVENLEKAMAVYKNVLSGDAMQFELTFKDTGIICEYNSFPLRDNSGNIIGTTTIARDISERKKAEEQIKQVAYFDRLTGLPSRALFMDRIEQGITRAHRSGQMLAVLYLDLDKFKPVNDTLGHDSGDAALKEIAGRLKDCLREMDTVARIGGDEFIFILDGINSVQDSVVVAEKVINALSTPISLQGKEYSIGGSIGIAIYPDDAEDSEAIINYADIAMYVAKSMGGNNYQFYKKK